MIDASALSLPVTGPFDGITSMPDNPADQAVLNGALSQLFSSMLTGPSVDAGDDSDSDE